MSIAKSEKDYIERRAFPRIKARCPVHYYTMEAGAWIEAILEDFSAGGVCFHSDETLLQDTKITIQITRDASPMVPALAASAVVVRCDPDSDSRYKIACKLTRVRNDNAKKNHYLRR